jgi:cysteine desulfurase
MLDPLSRLGRQGFEVTLLDVAQSGDPEAGRLDVNRVAEAIRADTLLVSVMLANNEIGVLQPLAEIGGICKERGVLLHTDATQAVGRIQVDVQSLGVDLLSFSAHKMYGPKGVGGLYVRRRRPHIRLQPQIEGGRQEGGLRSGTLNVPGIIGMATALRLCVEQMDAESTRQRQLRDRLYAGLAGEIDDLLLNGPCLKRPELRLDNNLNCSFPGVDGEALMMSMRDLAVSSGSACTSADPEPSHVLRALGLSADLTRSSLRFGLGRFTSEEEIDFAVSCVGQAVRRLRNLGSVA